MATELYEHAVDDGDFESFVNSEAVNVAGEKASAPVVAQLAAMIRTVFQQ